MSTEKIRVVDDTTLQGFKQDKKSLTVQSVQNANDSRMDIVSRNNQGDPTKIEWISDSMSVRYKASLYLVYDNPGNLLYLYYKIEDR